MLLDRDDFRQGVFYRDKNWCVICHDAGQDAHHIIERRLFPDGGYYLDNGVTVCGLHHMMAEQTLLSCEELRAAAGIEKVVLPPHLYPDDRHDKWGNVILPNGQRLRGELFDDESVQKVLYPVLNTFTAYVKYPRTWHLPWSPGATDDDRVLTSLEGLHGKEVVVTEKMDGENTTMYCDHIHARSLDSLGGEERHWVKNLHGQISYEIPMGWRLCGENLFAMHSIKYTKLSSYFLLFSVWNEKNVCLPWDDTVDWASMLGLNTVPVLFRGKFHEPTIRSLFREGSEGYVIRPAGSFRFREYKDVVGKFVRAGHNQLSHKKGLLVKNGLAGPPPND